DNSGVTMYHTDGGDSAKRVEMSAAVLVPEILHVPIHQHERLFVIEKNSRIQEFFAQMQDFISRRTAVFFRLVIKWRKLGKFHVDVAAATKRLSVIARLQNFRFPFSLAGARLCVCAADDSVLPVEHCNLWLM